MQASAKDAVPIDRCSGPPGIRLPCSLKRRHRIRTTWCNSWGQVFAQRDPPVIASGVTFVLIRSCRPVVLPPGRSRGPHDHADQAKRQR